ncbi:MAG: UDP-N-acetylglucosamine 2-epimerase (non-hydrolyzing) [Phaeodactylibacter sp.]|nr:UDP-N-acetylglucosamine 2-epimerase (non-hydrolyzing) [Phaeodactylibacter sp.]
MDKKCILFVVGARPNFVKIAPICRALQESGMPYKIAHTGQHYDRMMSDIFFEELAIPAPGFHLRAEGNTHARQTGEIMKKLEALCLAHPFAALVVIGDVNSTLAGALVGAKLHIPVAHVESGLRSFNRCMPEEINRIATDHISDLLFAPSRTALANLQREGLESKACFSGDVMYDMILKGLKMAERRSSILAELRLQPRGYYLATLHRPYNVDDGRQLSEIIEGLSRLKEKVILAAHPRLRKNLKRFGIVPGSNIQISEPLGYLDFILLEKNAIKIVTDSGGIQKEAFFVGTPCVTLRPETEWMETVAAGANILVKCRAADAIVRAVSCERVPLYSHRPYGDGRAGEIIVGALQARFCCRAIQTP